MDVVSCEIDAGECEIRGKRRRAADRTSFSLRLSRRSLLKRRPSGSRVRRQGRERGRGPDGRQPLAGGSHAARIATGFRPARSWSERSRGSTTPVSHWSGIPSIRRAASWSPGRPSRSCPNRSIEKSSSPSSRATSPDRSCSASSSAPTAKSHPRRGLCRPTVIQPIVQATLDGEQLVLTAQNEIVLRCGKASLTLTRAGKVLIRGTYLLSRSSGVNRIKGGSVQIN